MTNPETHPTPDLKGFVKEALSTWYEHAAKEYENPFHKAIIHVFYNYGMIADPDPSVEPYPEINPRIDEPTDAELNIFALLCPEFPDDDYGVIISGTTIELYFVQCCICEWSIDEPIPPEARAYILAAFNAEREQKHD